jgi:hypothetical protein
MCILIFAFATQTDRCRDDKQFLQIEEKLLGCKNSTCTEDIKARANGFNIGSILLNAVEWLLNDVERRGERLQKW